MRPSTRSTLSGLLLSFRLHPVGSGSVSSSFASASCLPTPIAPIAIPVRNVTMEGDVNNVRRGAALSMGTPLQTLAFSPVKYIFHGCLELASALTNSYASQMNTTHIYDLFNNPCEKRSHSIFVYPNATQAQCFSSYGGLFVESQSSTWHTASSASAVGINEDYLLNVSVLYSTYTGNVSYGVDTFMPSPNISMPSQPFVVLHDSTDSQEIPSEPYLMNSLGLGTNSTLLNALVTAGNISSRVWSYWDGWTGADSQNQSDGGLVLGGYDAAQTTGNNITIKFTTDPVDLYENDCNLIVTVRDIQLKYTNGTTTSILGAEKAKTVRYCIIPSFPGISLTNNSWVAFYELSGTQYLSNGVQRSTSHLSYWNNIVTAANAYVNPQSILSIF